MPPRKPMTPMNIALISTIGLCCYLVSCEKPSNSTTYITNNEIPVNEKEQSKSDTLAIDTELDSIEGTHSTGKLYLRYDNNTKEMKKWTILAPYEVKLHSNYIEVKFSGNYYMDGEPTGDGEKKLFIKKKDLKTILVSE